MKRTLVILLYFFLVHCSSQSKEELIDSIIKVNRVDSDCVGFGCSESEQYNNFQKLKDKLSEGELIELSKHNNATIRTYASIELIQSNKGNIPKMLSYELQKNEMVETFEGCIIGIDPVSSIIYHEYWNKIRLEASKKIKDDDERDIAMKNKLAIDNTMEKLDSVLINSKKEVYWLLYERAFKNRKYKIDYLPRIEELAFNYNNAYAFEYLITHYQSRYLQKTENYFRVKFPKAKFRDENEIFYLHLLIEILLNSEIEERNEIAIKKLKNNKDWEIHSSWFKRTLTKHGIEI